MSPDEQDDVCLCVSQSQWKYVEIQNLHGQNRKSSWREHLNCPAELWRAMSKTLAYPGSCMCF